jgi:hypothetical protein
MIGAVTTIRHLVYRHKNGVDAQIGGEFSPPPLHLSTDVSYIRHISKTNKFEGLTLYGQRKKWALAQCWLFDQLMQGLIKYQHI